MIGRRLESDRALVDECIERDLTAWSKFITKYSPLISSAIEIRLRKYGFIVHRQDIEDIRQDTLSSIWKGRKLETVKNRDRISYWLAIVAGNSAIVYMRRKHFQEPKTVSLFDKIKEKDIADLISSEQMSPKDEVANNELSKSIEDAFESLPAKERLIVKLYLIHDKKYDEIAGILNLPKGTVSSYIKRAKERLREKLKYFK